jgi:hypothetical protein
MIKAQLRGPVLGWAFGLGAGDENRTLTFSLGTLLIHAARAADQPGRVTVGVHD